MLLPAGSPASANTGYQLVAFGVKTNAAGTTVTDIGWARGNSDKGWREGDWIPAKLIIQVDQTEYPSLAGFPDINVGYDYTAGNQADSPRFIDLVRGIQLGDTDLMDSQGWPQPDGSPYPTGTGVAPFPTLDAVHTAQTSPGENEWTGFTLANTLTGWDPTTQVNVNYSGGIGTTDEGSRQFIITGDQVREWATDTGNLGTNLIIVYFQFHLARTFVWSNGLEEGYNTSPTDDWGGWLYGTADYVNPGADVRNGSGFAPGSSGHMYLNIPGVGLTTTQLPIPPQPAGLISGLKYYDTNANGTQDEGELPIEGWYIHIYGEDPEGLIFQTHSITDVNGYYEFPNLTEGTWYVIEHDGLGDPPQSGWFQTDPSDGETVPPVATAALVSGFPFVHPGSAAVGFEVDLTEINIVQNDVNFGNYQGIPDTAVTISTSADTVYAGDTVDLTVTESNTGDVDLTGAYVDVDNGVGTLSAPPTSGDDGDGVLEPGETWNWTVSGVVINADTTFTANGHGTDPLGNDISYANGYLDEQDSVAVDVIHPHTTMSTITYVYDTVTGNVEITIIDTNDGDVPLTDAHIHLRANGVEYGFSPMDEESPEFVGGDTSNPGVMDPGESWEWYVVVTITETTYFEAWGHGIDPLGGPVDYDPDTGEGFLTEYQDFEIRIGLLTRTQGFWGTHLDFTTYVLNEYVLPELPGGINLGWLSDNITTIDQVMGVFWGNNAKNSDGSKRDALCKARMIASQQALAAILNSFAPGGAPLPDGYSLVEITEILGGEDINAINMLNRDLDEFNNSGDDVAWDPSVPWTGRADPQEAKSVADIGFTDCLGAEPASSQGKGNNK